MAQGRPFLPSHWPRLPTGRLFLPGPLLPPSGEAGGCLDGRSPRAQQAFGPPPGESVRLPVAHMVCNQTPPVGDQPSLMTFREVETLFHEFGHALQVGFLRENQGLSISVLGPRKCFGLLVFRGVWVAWVLFFWIGLLFDDLSMQHALPLFRVRGLVWAFRVNFCIQGRVPS